jgi:hypothetical protein
MEIIMKYIALLIGLISFSVQSQNLNEERIWKLAARKKAIYLSSGVFHQNDGVVSTVNSIRSSSSAQQGYERIVVDFTTAKTPKIYGHISESEKKISVDFFQSTVVPTLKSLTNTKYVKSIDFLAIDADQVTMEVNLKNKYNYDVFYLENPGRLVIDIRP